jgi:hypothetical protein
VYVATPEFTFLRTKNQGWRRPDWLHTPQQGPRPAAGCRVAAEPPPSPDGSAANKRIPRHAGGLCGITAKTRKRTYSIPQRPLCGPEFSDVYSIGPDYLRPVYAALCVRFSAMMAETSNAVGNLPSPDPRPPKSHQPHHGQTAQIPRVNFSLGRWCFSPAPALRLTPAAFPRYRPPRRKRKRGPL